MITPRLIPVISLLNGKVVKTKQFRNPRYVGDPLNTITIFSKFEADELLVIDISTSHSQPATKKTIIFGIPNHASMPIGFGGGLNDIDGVNEVISSGFDKVLIRSHFQNRPFLSQISNRFGAQALSVCLDVVEPENGTGNHSVNGEQMSTGLILELLRSYSDCGVGEIILHDIDRDGTREGFRKLKLLDFILENSKIPIVAMGGCNSVEDAGKFLANNRKLHSIAAGAMFVYNGQREAVLLQYPSHERWNIAQSHYT